MKKKFKITISRCSLTMNGLRLNVRYTLQYLQLTSESRALQENNLMITIRLLVKYVSVKKEITNKREKISNMVFKKDSTLRIWEVSMMCNQTLKVKMEIKHEPTHQWRCHHSETLKNRSVRLKSSHSKHFTRQIWQLSRVKLSKWKLLSKIDLKGVQITLITILQKAMLNNVLRLSGLSNRTDCYKRNVVMKKLNQLLINGLRQGPVWKLKCKGKKNTKTLQPILRKLGDS